MRRLIRPALIALSLLVALPADAATLHWAAARDIGTFTPAFLNHVYEALVRSGDHLVQSVVRLPDAEARHWLAVMRP